ncbi:MAG: hypothetical protein MJE77_15385 [Proteobacteria bacterium]|nr:hypothetical protein [Pseudomonadota bacterium]
MTVPSRRREILEQIADPLGSAAVTEVGQICELFAGELASYGEVIIAPGNERAGLMIRGEDESFTSRVHSVMERWNMPEPGLHYHTVLAHLFEHRRAFFKMEWGGDGDRLVAFYFRRRPTVDRVIEQLGVQGVADDVLDRVRQFARLLGKTTVHFVSAALRPGSAVYHKIYLSQWVTTDTARAVAGRIERLLDAEGIGEGNRDIWSLYHNSLARPHLDSSLFVSISFTETALLPWVKIDYPGIAPSIAAALLAIDRQAGAETEMRALTDRMGVDELSYLGVRLNRDQPITLKYYCDYAQDSGHGG